MHRRELGVWVAAAVGLMCGVVVAGAAVVYVHQAFGDKAAIERLRRLEIDRGNAVCDRDNRAAQLWSARLDRGDFSDPPRTHYGDAKWEAANARVVRAEIEIADILTRHPNLRRHRIPGF